MKHIVVATMMLMSISSAFTLDLKRFLWNRNQSSAVTEEAQVVEVVRWRQPVCVLPAEGVLPCGHSLKKFQSEYEELSTKGLDVENRKQRRLTKLKLSESKEDFSIKLVSPEIVASVSLVNLQPSEASPGTIAEFIVQESLDAQVKTPELTEEQEKNVRGSKHLAAKDVAKPQQIYVTKVLDTPVTATLVADNCLPDIGMPLCDYQANVQPSKPVFHSKPSLSISVHKPATEQGSVGCLWEALFPNDSQQSLCGGLEKPIVEAPVLPVLVPRPEVIIITPSFPFTVASYTLGGSTEPKFEHIVRSQGTSHIVTDVGHEPGEVSSSSTSKFNFLEKPTQEMAPGQSIKTEITIELGTGDVVSEASEVSESSEPPRKNSSSQVHWNKHPFLQAIHGLVNKTKKSAVVQTLQHYLHRTGFEVQDSGSTSNGSGVLGRLSGPGSVFHHEKDETAMLIPEDSEETVEDTWSCGVITEQPLLMVEETLTDMNSQRKLKDDTS